MLDLQWDFDEAKAAWLKQGIEQGREQGIVQEKVFVAQKMLDEGEPFEKIRKFTELSLERIKELAQKINATKNNPE